MIRCTGCKKNKNNDEFYNDKNSSTGKTRRCKVCVDVSTKKAKEKRKAINSGTYIEPPPATEHTCIHCSKTKPLIEFQQHTKCKNGFGFVCKECYSKQSTARLRTPEGKARRMTYSAKQKAKKMNIPFNIEPADLIVPTHCPVLGIPLCFDHPPGGPKDDAPSLDRIIPELGYVTGNVIVVSQRANRLKNDASLSEMRKILEFYEKHC